MPLLAYLGMTLLHLLALAIDITAFFLLIRTIQNRWQAQWAKAFDQAGKGLVDGYIKWIDRMAKATFKKTLCTRDLFIWAFISLAVVKLILSALMGTIIVT